MQVRLRVFRGLLLQQSRQHGVSDATPIPVVRAPRTPLEGGVPIIKDGQRMGAVGVSGVKSTEDAQIARAGIAALGL